jgi:hypothetical protein
VKGTPMKIEVDSSVPYAADIMRFICREYPIAVSGDREGIVDTVADEIIGTGQARSGSKPNPESYVAIRQVVRENVELDRPIPILVPAGPKKPLIGESVDVAEMSALRMLSCLNDRITKYWPQGAEFRIRLEDITGWFLEGHVPGVNESIATYLQDFEALINVLELEKVITPVRESSMMSLNAFRELTLEIAEPMGDFVKHTDEGFDGFESLAAWKKLNELGWKGEIPAEQRNFYRGRFAKLIPDMSPAEIETHMVNYLSSTLARVKLGATGVDKNWKGVIQLNFAPPVPGIPRSLVSTRVHYRTAPLSMTKMHVPYWRAKGFLKVNNEVKIGLSNWFEDLDLETNVVKLRRDDKSVDVRADYIIEEE